MKQITFSTKEQLDALTVEVDDSEKFIKSIYDEPNTEIKINELAEEEGLTFEDAMTAFLARRGQKRNFIQPAQVAKLIIFLCQDSSLDITGAVLPIDQGRSATWLEFGQ